MKHLSLVNEKKILEDGLNSVPDKFIAPITLKMC